MKPDTMIGHQEEAVHFLDNLCHILQYLRTSINPSSIEVISFQDCNVNHANCIASWSGVSSYSTSHHRSGNTVGQGRMGVHNRGLLRASPTSGSLAAMPHCHRCQWPPPQWASTRRHVTRLLCQWSGCMPNSLLDFGTPLLQVPLLSSFQPLIKIINHRICLHSPAHSNE